jgi:hypothetical protein
MRVPENLPRHERLSVARIQFIGGIFGNFGTPSAKVAQAGALEVWMLTPGLKMLGSSRLAGLIPIASGRASALKNKGEPQVAQKPRLIFFPLPPVTA